MNNLLIDFLTYLNDMRVTQHVYSMRYERLEDEANGLMFCQKNSLFLKKTKRN